MPARAAIGLLLCAALLVALSGCALAARALTVVEAIDTAQDVIGGAPDPDPVVSTTDPVLTATVTGTGGSGLRLNGRPGGDRLTAVPDGTGVTVLCRADGPERAGPFGPTSAWLRVRIPDGRVGYMSGAYLDIDPAAVPPCTAFGDTT